MRKLKRIFESTLSKVISISLALLILFSVVFYFDVYKKELNKIRGYYWVYKGDKAFKKQNLQEAISLYQKGIKYHPEHYKALYNLANIYVVYEDYYQALENYEKALKIKPDCEVARIDYAIVLSQVYKTDEAINQYKKILENKPKFIKVPFLIDTKQSYIHNKGVAYHNLGVAYRTKSLLAGLDQEKSLNYLQKASNSYKEATKILNSYNSNYNLGLIHQLLKNTNQAGYYYCKAIEIEPMQYEAHFNLAVLLNDLKMHKEASQEFARAGILLDVEGNHAKTKYIYDILSEVNQKIAILKDDEKKEFYQKLMQEDDQSIQYENGKISLKEAKDDKFIESFKICASKEYFMGEK